MKILTTIILVFSLSGCAAISNLYESYFMAPYDTNEHFLVNKIKVYSEYSKKNCANREAAKTSAIKLFSLSSQLKSFSANLPENSSTSKMTDSLFVLVDELYKRYNTTKEVNKTYCELKLQSISDSANTIQKVIVKRPRP
jgi:hypothetical protein